MQFHNLRTVSCISEVQVPSPVLGRDRSGVQRDFHTLVLDVTGIDQLFGDTRLGRNSNRHNLVLGVFLIVSEVDTDAVVDETPVKTYFP